MEKGEGNNPAIPANPPAEESDENSSDARYILFLVDLSLMRIIHESWVISLADARQSNLNETWPIELRYKTKEKRLASFKNWTNESTSKERLAHAGFYYTGEADVVRCFRCGGGLYDWKPADDPWETHARFFPHCDHIKEFPRRPTRAQVNQQDAIPRHRNSGDQSQDDQDINGVKALLTCRRCEANQPNTLFIPCYHAVYCWECSTSFTRCPSCNTNITNTFRFSFFGPGKPNR